MLSVNLLEPETSNLADGDVVPIPTFPLLLIYNLVEPLVIKVTAPVLSPPKPDDNPIAFNLYGIYIAVVRSLKAPLRTCI